MLNKKLTSTIVTIAIFALAGCAPANYPISNPQGEAVALLTQTEPTEITTANQPEQEPQGDNPPTFTSAMRINENMPELTFVRILGDFVANPEMSHEERYIAIHVLDGNGELLQVMDNIIQGGHADWVVADHDFFELQFDDFNFDGYMDMRLFTAVNPGSASGAWAYFWLWDSDLNLFVKNAQLSEISGMAWLGANQDTMQIEVSSRGGGGGPFVTQYYEWVDGELAEVASVVTEWIFRHFADSYLLTTRRNHLTGEITHETDPPDSLPDMVITKTVDINPDMPFPTFEVTLQMWRLAEDSEHRVHGYQYEIDIFITYTAYWQGRAVPRFQSIRGLRAGYGAGRWIEIDPQNPLNLHFADFNGDGYLDMALRRFPPQTGGMADDTHYFWLFNPAAATDSSRIAFVRNHSLEQAASSGQIVNIYDGYVEIFSFHSLMSQYLSRYAYADGEFVFVDMMTYNTNTGEWEIFPLDDAHDNY